MAVERDCTFLKMESAPVSKFQKKNKDMDISEKPNKINNYYLSIVIAMFCNF